MGGSVWRRDIGQTGMCVNGILLCKLLLICKQPPLEYCVSIWSSCRGKILVKGRRRRTVAPPVDCQRRRRLLPWKWELNIRRLLIGSDGRPQILIFEVIIVDTWQWEQHGSRRKTQLLAREAGHAWGQREGSSTCLIWFDNDMVELESKRGVLQSLFLHFRSAWFL